MPETVAARLRRALAGLHREPAQPRLPFEIDGRVVGSVLPADAGRLAAAVPGLMLEDDALCLLPVCSGDAGATLHAVAEALRAAGRAARWRNEPLPVLADDGSLVGTVERACMRVLGLRTLAVHVVAETGAAGGPPRGSWLQRRAAHKDTDPGMLDNLASGLIGMAPDGRSPEAPAAAAAREAWEEAGIEPGGLVGLSPVGRWRLQAPVREGLMVEDVLVWSARIDPATRPTPRDGEVSEFIHVANDELLARIDAGELTTGATLAQLACLARHAPG